MRKNANEKKKFGINLGEILGFAPLEDSDEELCDTTEDKDKDKDEATNEGMSDETVLAINKMIAEEAEKMRQAEIAKAEADAPDEADTSEDPEDDIFEDESTDESKKVPDGTDELVNTEDVVSAIIEKAEAERQKLREAHQKTLSVLKPANPVVSEEENTMQSRIFYNELGDMAYEFDRTGELDVRLADYVKSVIARDGKMLHSFMQEYLSDYILRNPDQIKTIESYIKKAAENNINLVVMYHNPNTDEMFENWDCAVSSIQDDLDKYPDIKPENVFKKLWFEVDCDGNIGKKPVSEAEVEKYVDEFRGNKAALRKKLALPEKPAKKSTQRKADRSDSSSKSDKSATGSTKKKKSSATSRDEADE